MNSILNLIDMLNIYDNYGFKIVEILNYCFEIIKNLIIGFINFISLTDIKDYISIIWKQFKLLGDFIGNDFDKMMLFKTIFIIIIFSIIFGFIYKIINYMYLILCFVKNTIIFALKNILKIFNIFNIFTFKKNNKTIIANEFIEIKFYDKHNLKQIKIINNDALVQEIKTKTSKIIDKYIIIDSEIMNKIIDDNLKYYSVKIHQIGEHVKKN